MIVLIAPVLATLLCLSPAYAADQAAAATPNKVIESNIYVDLAKKLIPSVVNISTFTTVKGQFGPGTPDDLFRRFFEDMFRQHQRRGGGEEEDEEGPPPPARPPKAMSLGTGFIIDASGIILTNNHVVGDADEIKIFFTELPDEKPTDGEVLGRDPELDVALIKVKTKRELIPVVLGDSDQLEVGEYVLAIGNPFGQGHSVTHGIISAKGRMAPDFPLATYIQTDAPINPGNSGGPLVNLKGEVIGINNAIEQRAQGIGFAIPVSPVKKIIPQLKTKGSVSRGYIGVQPMELTPEIATKIGVSKDLKAPVVAHVFQDAPAEKAGLKPYDVILEFNNKPIHAATDLVAAVTSVPVGQTVPMKIMRSGQEKILSIKVAERPGAQRLGERKAPKKEKKTTHVETGMTLADLTPEIAKDLGIPEKTRGAVVESVAYGGSADKAGLLRGDVILEVDRKAVKDADGFYSIVKEKKSYLLRIRRPDPQGRETFLVIVLDLKE